MQIISTFKEKPKTKTAWRAMWLGLAVLFVPPFLGFFAAVIRPLIDSASADENGYLGQAMGLGAIVTVLIFSILALITSIRAFRLGERSWVMWLGFIPSMLIAAFWIFMIVGELLFEH